MILDVMTPKIDGFEVARRVKISRCGVSILMLTACSELGDRIRGLNTGADYYLTKPFDSRELLTCINALLRRQGREVNGLTMGNTSFDLSSCTLLRGDETVRLSARCAFSPFRV